jgi:uncharacterized protein YgiM (DUF1202 family)
MYLQFYIPTFLRKDINTSVYKCLNKLSVTVLCTYKTMYIFSKENRKTEKKKKKAISMDGMQTDKKETE